MVTATITIYGLTASDINSYKGTSYPADIKKLPTSKPGLYWAVFGLHKGKYPALRIHNGDKVPSMNDYNLILMIYKFCRKEFLKRGIYLFLLVYFVMSCNGKKESNVVNKYIYSNVETYYYENNKVKMKVFLENNEHRGWFMKYNRDGTKKEEGLILTKDKFVKHYTFSLESNSYFLKLYFKKNNKFKLQQAKYFDIEFETIDSLGTYLTLNRETKDSVSIGYYSRDCNIDSIKVFDKARQVYSSYLLDSGQNVDLPKSDTLKNYLLEYYCEANNNTISSRRVIFNLDFCYFSEEDIELLKYISKIRMNNDINSFFR